MKTNIENRIVTKSEEFEEEFFGISKEGTPFILDILRNKLYSDKIMAVTRELSANSWDAHVEAGVSNVPIEVSLPNRLDMNFKVRDFGKGLSPEEMKKVYIQYGSSTKRKSNDYIGQLGLGNKSPWCYGDNFLVTSFQKGHKTIYNCYIDETKVGKIAKMAEENTKEPDGLEVSVPVRQEDIEAFATRAVKLYAYFKVKPIIKGINPIPTFDRGVKELVTGDGWKIFEGNIKPVAIMGNIAYPIEYYSIHEKLEEKEKEIIEHGIEIDFEIGELCIAASREALEYNDKTIKAIADKLKSIAKEIEKNATERIEKAKNILEARRIWATLPRFLRQPVTWNGTKINESHFLVGNGDFHVYMFGKNRRGTLKKSSCTSFDADNTTLLYKMDIKNGIKPRVAYLFSQHEGLKHVVLVDTYTPNGEAQFTDQTKIELKDLINLSTVPKWVDPNAPTHTYSKRIQGTLFKLNENLLEKELTTHYSLKRSNYKISDFWTPVDDVPADSVYVKIELFHPVHKNIKGLREFFTYLNDFRKTYGVKFDLYGVKEKGIAGLDEDSQSLKDYETETVQEFIDNLNPPNEIKTIYSQYNLLSNIINNKIALPNSVLADKVSEIRKIQKQAKSNEKLLEQLNRARHFSSDAKFPEIKTIDLDEILEELSKIYPLLSRLEKYSFNEQTMKAIVEYVELIEEKREKTCGKP